MVELKDIMKKDIITMADLKDVIETMTKMKQDTENFATEKSSELGHYAVSELLSDANMIQRFIEMASDQEEEDIKDQEKIFDFLVILYKAMEGTHYESKVRPVAHSLSGGVPK
jgi:hypothetical protein